MNYIGANRCRYSLLNVLKLLMSWPFMGKINIC